MDFKMNIDEMSQDEQWDRFLEVWPVERLKSLRLEEYTTSADDRVGDNPDYPFTYWLESLSEDLGSIWGGSAFKFGIYKRGEKSEKTSDKSRSYNKDYGWYSKFGKGPKEAFENVKREIINIIDNVQKGDLKAIDASPLGDVLSWKVAFIYQDRDNPVVAPIYAARSLRETHKKFTQNTPMSECHTVLLSERENRNIFEYAAELLDYEQNDAVVNSDSSPSNLQFSRSNKSNFPLMSVFI